VAAPRRAQSLTVVAIGRDEHGVPVVTVRRPVAVESIARAARSDTAAVPVRPRLGEDGLAGSRVVDMEALEAARDRANGVPPRAVRTSWPVGRFGWRTNPVQR
jgi:hypothetical protein